MISELPLLALLGILVFFAVLAAMIQRIDRRQKEMLARIGRLSLTFQKIENDLEAIQSSLLILSRNEPDMAEQIRRIRERRALVFRHIVENGPSASEILRGIEWPSPEDDPKFWRGDKSIADRMKLPETLDATLDEVSESEVRK